MRPVITIGYDSDAYEENSFASIRSFFENQKANVKLVHVLRKALDVPSIIEITLHISATYFLKGFFTEAGKDVWKELKEVLNTHQPEIVGMTAMSCKFQSAVKVAKIFKNFNPKGIVLLGGAHATICSEEAVKNKFIDLEFYFPN